MQLDTRRLFVIALFLGLFTMILRPVADPDFWWHLRTGQLIVETGTLPQNDPFSYTKLGEPWITHEWLSEILLYRLYQIGGYGLLVFIFSTIITAAFLLVFLRSPGKPYATGFSVLLAALSSAPAWGVRPQMVSLFFTAAFFVILDSVWENRHYRNLLLLPVFTLLWVNLHAGYILGFIMIGTYTLGESIGILKSISRREKPVFRPIIALGITLVLCVFAALANPNTYRILLYPFETITSTSMMQFIQEWFSPDFHQLEWMPFAVLLLTLIVAANLSKKSIPPPQLILIAVFGFMALRSMRNIPLFALLSIPVLSTQLNGINDRITRKHSSPGFARWLNPLIVTVLIIVTSFRFIMVLQEQQTTEQKQFPKGAVTWILENQPKGNIFNTYGWGGYLIWRLYPEYLVYIDGRADIYGDQFIYHYLGIYYGQPDWEVNLQETDVGIIMIEPDSGLAYALEESSEWKRVYQDDLSVLFTKK